MAKAEQPRQVTHEIRVLTLDERVLYRDTSRRCLTSCAAPLAYVLVYRYKSAGGRGETVVTHPRCAAHGARWAVLHGLEGGSLR